MSRKLFLNLAVRDLNKSMEFFSKLGFEFDRRFTDEKAACMIVSGEAFVMLLSEPSGRSATPLPTPRGSSRCRARVERRWTKWCRRPSRPAASTPPMPRITASCTAGASTIPTGITGKCCGWTPRRCSDFAEGGPGSSFLGEIEELTSCIGPARLHSERFQRVACWPDAIGIGRVRGARRRSVGLRCILIGRRGRAGERAFDLGGELRRVDDRRAPGVLQDDPIIDGAKDGEALMLLSGLRGRAGRMRRRVGRAGLSAER